jgi:NRAMP (natural resistance-associated macrophage protein)-like metal ion transporter
MSIGAPTELPPKSIQTRFCRYCAGLGPGLVTGCADDDPSGISTYSMAGAAAGYGLLWTALLSLPLMISVQMMCGRLGMVTGRGLAGVIRRRYPKWVLWGACLLLVTANIINIAADLGGMGQGAELVTGISSLIWTPVFTIVMTGFLFWSSYRQIARIFKWLTLVLLAYVGTAFLAHVDWRAAFAATFLPHISWSRDYLALLLGILGTTISPYLFSGKRHRKWKKNGLREGISHSAAAQRMANYVASAPIR